MPINNWTTLLSPATFAEDIAQLQAAHTAARTREERTYYKTKLEQAYGREAIRTNNRNEHMFGCKKMLQERFGERAILAVSWREENSEYPTRPCLEYWVDVLVQPADGGPPMTFTEPLKAFPSEECLANLALVT